MAFKIVGADENSDFPARVETRLQEKFAGRDGSGKVPLAQLPVAEIVAPVESDVADLETLTTTGRLSEAELTATFVKPVARTLVVIGDSITEQGGMLTASPHRNTTSFWTWGLNLLGQRLDLLANLGVGGQRTDEILARIANAVALAPGWMHVLAGTNDVGQDVPTATSTANLTAIYDAVQSAGIRLIVGTIPPRTTASAGQKERAAALNQWIREEASRRVGVILVDYEAALTDQGTGGYPPHRPWINGLPMVLTSKPGQDTTLARRSQTLCAATSRLVTC